MKRVCYFCAKYMDEKDDNRQEGVFHSLCDECARRLRLDEKLPELLWAIAALRQKNGGQELSSLQLEPLLHICLWFNKVDIVTYAGAIYHVMLFLFKDYLR